MRNIFSLIILLLGVFIGTQAQNIPIRFNNEWLTLDYDLLPSRCVSLSDTIEVSINGTWQQDEGVSFQQWVLRGDLQFAEGYSASSFPSTRIVSPANGYAKGRISYKYRTDGCSSAVSVDVYKSFILPDSVQIEGPECIVEGQTVVYSIEPLLTKNLGDQIGMDSYSWNVLSTTSPSFVDEILYVSGDSSSVTFLVGEVTGTPEITVSVGRCNSNQIRTLSLGNSTPRPELPDTMLVPVGVDSFLVGLNNPNNDVEYTWKSNIREFTIYPYADADSAVVRIDENANQSDCKIIVTGEFKNITCNTSSDTMQVVRSWGSSVSITDNNHINDSCYTIGRNYSFSVVGDIPINAEYKWILPNGWEYQNANDSLKRTIVIRPTSSAQLADVIRVKPNNPQDTAHTREYQVRVKPITLPQARIITPSCLDMTSNNRIYADTLGMNLPNGIEFQWNIANATIISGQGTDTIWFTPTTSTNSVQLVLKGEAGCDGESIGKALSIPPIAPTGIVIDHCVAIGMPDTILLTLQDTVSNQYYQWNLSNNLLYHSGNEHKTQIQVITNGTSGTYPISAYGVGAGECSASASVGSNIVIDTPLFVIETQLERTKRSFFLDPWDLEDIDSYIWYLDGDSVSDDTEISVPRSTTSAFVEVIVTFSDGCRQYASYVLGTRGTNENNMRMTQKTGHVEHPNSVVGDIVITPNPAKNEVRVSLPTDDEETLIRLFDSNGRVVYRSITFSQNNTIDTSSLPDGIYVLVAVINGERKTQQLLIKH